MLGWQYEERVYRKRMKALAFKTMELQAHGERDRNPVFPVLKTFQLLLVLPENMIYTASMTDEIADELEQLWREPQGMKKPPVVKELRSLVHKKILDQDAKTRSQLASLKWNIEDQSAIHLLYGTSQGVEWVCHRAIYFNISSFIDSILINTAISFWSVSTKSCRLGAPRSWTSESGSTQYSGSQS